MNWNAKCYDRIKIFHFLLFTRACSLVSEDECIVSILILLVFSILLRIKDIMNS